MAAFYLAPSLAQLRAEINAAHPKRDKLSDGWVGDTAHAARKSDHNPDYAAGGVVRAIDVDKDGIDTAKLLKVTCADPRVEYVIWEGNIYTRSSGFAKRVYTGSNRHFAHMHISGRHGGSYENDVRSWGYAEGAAVSVAKPIIEIEEDEPLLTSVEPNKRALIALPKSPAGKKVYVRFASDEPGGGVNIRVAGGWGQGKWAPLKDLNKVDGYTGWILNGQATEWDVSGFQILSVENKGKTYPLGVTIQIR